MTLLKCQLLLAALIFLLSGKPIQAQNLDSLLNNKRVYGTINIGELPLPKIDGELDDVIWSLGEWQGNFTQQQPVGGAPGSENTYIKVLYDRSNLFVAIICQDSEPDLIRYTNLEEHVWRMHVWRWISRKAGEDQWQYIPLQAPAMVYLFGELEGVKQICGSRQVEFLPYVSAGLEYNGEENGGPGFRPNAGIDAKVGISSDYTLDLSINPDYGQVEADPSVLNLTAFETFYQEKRSFFMEGNEIFDFELDGDIPYYSRRIGSAAKLTGKSSKGLSVGVVNGLTAGEYALATNDLEEEKEIQVLPMSKFFSSRVKKEFNEGNTIFEGVFSLVNRLTSDSIYGMIILVTPMNLPTWTRVN